MSHGWFGGEWRWLLDGAMGLQRIGFCSFSGSPLDIVLSEIEQFNSVYPPVLPGEYKCVWAVNEQLAETLLKSLNFRQGKLKRI